MFASSTPPTACAVVAIQSPVSVSLRTPLFKLSPLEAKLVHQWTCKDVQLWLHFVFDLRFDIPLGEDADLQDKILAAQVCGLDLIKNVSNLRYFFKNHVLIDDGNCRKAITAHVKKLEQNNWRFDGKSYRIYRKIVTNPYAFCYFAPKFTNATVLHQMAQQCYANETEVVKLLYDSLKLDPAMCSSAMSFVIKLVVSDIAVSDFDTLFKSVVSLFRPIRYGLNHTAIVFGAVKLDWTTSSLVLINEAKSNYALVAVPFTVQTSDIHALLQRLAQTIVRWNLTKTYDRFFNSCQQFVDEVFAQLNIEPRFDGLIAQYMDQVRSGEVERFIWFRPQVARALRLSESYILFESHQALDMFVHQILKRMPDFKNRYPDEFALLKAFDDAFWINLKSGNVEKNRPYCLAPKLNNTTAACPIPVRGGVGHDYCPFMQ